VLLTGVTVTVIAVFNGMFEHCTTTETGLDCNAEITASGVVMIPVGDADTGTPATLAIVNCVPEPAAGITTNCEPWLKTAPFTFPVKLLK
jgi:hypothetical protein